MQLERITKIIAETEVEPAIHDVTVVYDDGSEHTGRLNVFDLMSVKARLGLPVES